MARGLGGLLVSFIAGGFALVTGLAGATLRTGRLDPLDWLFPAMLAMAGLSLFAARGGREISWLRLGAIWAVVTLPALLFIILAGMGAPFAGLALLALSLVIAVMAVAVMRSRGLAARMATLSLLIVSALLVPFLVAVVREGPAKPNEARPVVAVLSAMPLQGIPMGAAEGTPAADSIGLRSPIWAALGEWIDLRALDGLDESSLAGIHRLLLAQPRALSPAELVALDAWVRRGGQAVILSDPLLQWPDPRPLAHPLRAPLTSLLDPLLSHWGLRLEPAEISVEDDAVERRALASGAMVQLAGASKFTIIGKGSSCTLSEQGLIATCRIGTGRAVLMADADWINDRLWTLSPDQPLDRQARTSDAAPLLAAWLRGEEMATGRWSTWLVGKDSLIVGLRYALALAALLTLVDWLVARRPSLSQRRSEINMDQIRNRNKTSREMG